MMFFIPPAILAIEDEDDRSFMENAFNQHIPHSQNESGNERENAA